MKLEVKEIPQPKREFVLTLDEREAAVVKILCGAVSGAGPNRSVSDQIYTFFEGHDVCDLDLKGTVTFRGEQ